MRKDFFPFSLQLLLFLGLVTSTSVSSAEEASCDPHPEAQYKADQQLCEGNLRGCLASVATDIERCIKTAELEEQINSDGSISSGNVVFDELKQYATDTPKLAECLKQAEAARKRCYSVYSCCLTAAINKRDSGNPHQYIEHLEYPIEYPVEYVDQYMEME